MNEAIQELENADKNLQEKFEGARKGGTGGELILPKATLEEIDQAFARVTEAEKKLDEAWRNFCIDIKR